MGLGAAGLWRDRVAVEALGGDAVAFLVAAQSARQREQRRVNAVEVEAGLD